MKYRLLKHYLPLIISSVILGVISHFIWPKKDWITLVADVTGYIAIVVIAVTLIIGPLNILLNRKNPVTSYFRRDCGISGGILAVIHSISGLFVHLRGNMWQYFTEKTGTDYKIRLDDFGIANYTGLLSTLLILALLATSNDYFFLKLKVTQWKNIQRLSYLMVILALIHIVYYRLNNLGLVYSFYLPMISTILAFQVYGFITVKRKLKS